MRFLEFLKMPSIWKTEANDANGQYSVAVANILKEWEIPGNCRWL